MRFQKLNIIITLVIGFNFLFFTFVVGQIDSLVKRKKMILIEVDYAIPFYNKFKIQNTNDYNSKYVVNSKLQSQFYFGFKYHYKKINFGINASYLLNEFTGRKFVIEGFDATHSQNVIYKYNIIQKVKYDYCNLGLSYGLNHFFKKRSEIEFNLHALFTCFYRSRIFNYYYSEQFGYDTTQILAQNVKSDYNSGVVPRFAIDLKYHFWFTDRLALSTSLLFYYSYSITDYSNQGVISPEKGVFAKNTTQNPYGLYYNAYTVKDQKFISVLLGLQYRIF